MAEQAVKFARLLTEAIYRIRARESKAIRIVEDELGYALGKKGGASIEHWRKGNVPPKLTDVEALAREVTRRSEPEPKWLQEFLQSAGHPQALRFAEEIHPGATAVATSAAEAIDDKLAAVTGPVGNLPVPPTPFIGRSQELTAVAERLDDPSCRLLTLVGLGGIGKTRLAIQAALTKSDKFPDGIYFVSLVSLGSSDLLVSTIANAIDVSFYSGSSAKVQLLSYLREKEILLIMDNFEHLMGEVGLCAEILEQAAGVKILVTSRERLNLQGEWVYAVEGMPFPIKIGNSLNGINSADSLESYGAVGLFLQSARRVRADFTLSERDLPYVIRICQLVEGIPLGIELAAAWMKLLSCEEIAREIEQNYDFLATVWRDVPERHRSLQAVFNYSWNLLEEKERKVMSKLSVFRGGFTRQAAAEVTGASLLVLSALVDKSILHRRPLGQHESASNLEPRARYDMHELLRHYGEEKLVEREDVQDRHCHYYVTFLQQKWSHLRGGRQKETLEEIGEEIENVRAAWAWAVAEGKEQELGKSLDPLFYFYDIRGWVQEGEEVFATAVARLRPAAGPDHVILGQLLARQGRFDHRLGLYEKAGKLLQESLSIFRNLDMHVEVAFSLNYLGNIAYRLGDYASAREICQESLTICRQMAFRWEMVTALETLAHVAEELGEYHQARALCEEGLTICLAIGDRRGIAAFLNGSGYLQWRLGDMDEARRLCQEGLAIYREIGDRRGTAMAIKNLGNVASYLEDYELAQQHYQESLSICHEIGYQWGIAASLNNLGNIAWALEEFKEAKSYCEQSLEMWRRLGDQWGSAGTLETLGSVSIALEEWAEARDYFRDALRIATEIKAAPLALQILIGMASLMHRQNQTMRALEILIFVINHPVIDQEGKHKAESVYRDLAAALPAQIIARAQARGEMMELESVVAEMMAG